MHIKPPMSLTTSYKISSTITNLLVAYYGVLLKYHNRLKLHQTTAIKTTTTASAAALVEYVYPLLSSSGREMPVEVSTIAEAGVSRKPWLLAVS